MFKHISMTEQSTGTQDNGGYYSFVCCSSMSGECDEIVMAPFHSNAIQTLLVRASDNELTSFLESHLERKKKSYSMIKYCKER
jgi:hypothetical protein